MWNAAIEPCQIASPADEHERGRDPFTRPGSHDDPSAIAPLPRAAAARRRAAAARAPPSRARRSAGPRASRRFAGTAGRSSTIPAMRPGRGLITTTRVERNTASEIECVTKTTVERSCCQIESSSRFSRSRVISSSAPNGSSISSSAGSNESARAIETRCCIPPESCHGWWSPKPVSSTRSSISFTRAARRRLVPAEHLERQRDVLRDGPPVEQHGVLEDDPVVAVDARLRRRLAVDRDRAGGRLDEVADHAEERRLAAPGRADQRDELAGLDLEVDLLERGDVAARERLRDVLDLDDRLLGCVHAAHLRCAPDDDSLGEHDRDEEDDPERGRDDVRRPELLRLDRVVLVEVEDRAAEAGLEPGRQLADDRADDARGRRDPQRREDVRQRRRHPHLPEHGPAAGRVRCASARARSGRRTGGRAAC